MDSDYGDPKYEPSIQLPRPSARPISNSCKYQTEHFAVPHNNFVPINEQQLLYESQASRPPYVDPYSTQNDDSLDLYGGFLRLLDVKEIAKCCLDRAVLDEPQPHSRRQAGDMRTLPAGRLSQPFHTASHSSVNAFQEDKWRG